MSDGADVVASPVILDVSEHLGVELPLSVVGVGEATVPQVNSGHQCKPYKPGRTPDSSWTGVLASLNLGGPSYSSVVLDVVASPVIWVCQSAWDEETF